MARLLLVHGLGGTGATMAPLAAELIALGHEAADITLPGHGTDPADLVGCSWQQWLDTVAVVADHFRADVVVGQSLGGALALALAARAGDGSARPVVAINPPAADPDALDGLEWRRVRGHHWVDGAPLEDGEVGYSTLPIGALIEMTNGILTTDLSRVTVPVLLVTSALDEVVDPDSATIVAASVGGPLDRLVLATSGHCAVLGPERSALARGVHDFVCTLAL